MGSGLKELLIGEFRLLRNEGVPEAEAISLVAEKHRMPEVNVRNVLSANGALAFSFQRYWGAATDLLFITDWKTRAFAASGVLFAVLMLWNMAIEPTYAALFRPSSSELSPGEYEKCADSFSACEDRFIDWTGHVSRVGADVYVDVGDVRLKLPDVDGDQLGLVKGQRVRFSGYLKEGGIFSLNKVTYPEIEALESVQAARARKAAADAAYERKLERDFDERRPDWGSCYVLSQGDASVAADCEQRMRESCDIRGL